MTRLTRRYKFAASHRLTSSRFSEEENSTIYGKCNNPYGHGHDYVLEVTVAGPVDPLTGQVVKLGALDRLVSERLLKDFDHKYLNAEVSDFQTLVPTSENILKVVEDRLRRSWPSVFPGEWPRLERIRLQETRRNTFELRMI
jgi:6-pyruvoyltetrahydropterin/6-carboxytetrahydropterin synthase